MNMDDDKYTNFSLLQNDTSIPPRIPETPLPDIPVTPRTPKKTHLEQLPFSKTTTAVLRAIRKVRVECLPEYFEQMCDRGQHETAVICGTSQLTYQELDHQANRLAHFLISHGIGKGDPIGILLERSLYTYIALLGVLKAGAVFVPLDPSFPSDHVAFIAKDAGLRGLMTTSTFHEKTYSLQCPALELDRASEVLSAQPETRPQVSIDPASLCYINYTLDANGWPKGLAVSHSNIVNFLHVITSIYAMTYHDRVYQDISIASDASFAQIWPAWIGGATLVASPADTPNTGHRLTEFLLQHKITVLYCRPGLLATIERDVPSLRLLLVAGGECPAELINRWSLPRRRMLNMYGSPETIIAATWCELYPGRAANVHSPLPGYHIYILDNQLRPVEDGKSGEICIGGLGVTMGYLNRPDLTNERFIPDLVARDREVVNRIYRTGDIGRITLSREVEYLRRINTQANLQSHDDSIQGGKIKQVAIPQTAPAFLNEIASMPQLTAITLSEPQAKPAKPGLASRLNVKNIYNLIMTDPLYRNSLFNMASTFMLGGLGFFFWIIVARLYKTEDVGVATTIISIMTLLNSFTVMGLNSSLNRYLPKSTHKNELINSSFVIVTIVTFMASVIFLLGLQFFSPHLVFLRSNLFYAISFTLFVIFSSWNMLVESTFMAFRAAGNILIKNSIISLLKIALPFAFIALGAYGIFASVASAFALGVIFGLGVLVVRLKVRPSLSINISQIRGTLAYSFANYIVSFMFNMPSLILPVIILNVLSAKYAAYYYVASMIQSILLVIPIATAQSLLTEGSYNEAGLKKHAKKALGTIALILVPATMVIVFAGNILLQAFGKSYASEAFQFLQLYGISTIFTSLLLIANAIMNVKHQIKTLVIVNVLVAILTLGLSYAFISNKLVGVGWGWVLGQAIAGLVAFFYIIRVIRNPQGSKGIR